MVIEINNDNFNDVIKSENLSVIKLGAEWCGPCRMVKPVLEKVSNSENDGVTYGDLDIEKFPEIAGELQIRSIPTTLFYKNGKQVKTYVGAFSEVQLKEMVNEVKSINV